MKRCSTDLYYMVILEITYKEDQEVTKYLETMVKMCLLEVEVQINLIADPEIIGLQIFSRYRHKDGGL